MVQIAPQRPPGRFGEESVLLSPTELLSRDHALMERLMIVFESVIARVAEGDSSDLRPINRAAALLKEIGAEHHMVDEEELIFPKIEASGSHEDLLKTLRLQHDAGRAIFDRVLELTETGTIESLPELNEMANLCMSFNVMYRAHAAAEETVLFPALYDYATNDEILNIQAILRGQEEGMLKRPEFRRLLDSLAVIEGMAGTSDLNRFTPR